MSSSFIPNLICCYGLTVAHVKETTRTVAVRDLGVDFADPDAVVKLVGVRRERCMCNTESDADFPALPRNRGSDPCLSGEQGSQSAWCT